jgi:hypothetical protein
MSQCSNRRFGIGCLLVGFLFLAGGAHAADVLVPTLDLVTRGAMNGSVFELASCAEMDISFDGGSKIGGSVAFGYSNTFLEQPAPENGLTFKKVSVTVRELFSLPISFSWFIGKNDLLYDGIHGINGTGFKFEVSPIPEALLFSLYAYEDTGFLNDVVQPDGSIREVLIPGNYSGDIRMLADFGSVKIEAFFGATYAPASLYGYYRGGTLFYAAGGETVEFLAQIGVPRYDPGLDPAFSINLLYVLFEPRLHIGLFSITPTFFWHPGYYLQKPTGETGSFDVNLDLSLGDVSDFGVRGGIESNFRYISSTNAFSFVESPYVSFAAMGILWDIKLNARLEWPFTLGSFSGTIGIKAEF